MSETFKTVLIILIALALVLMSNIAMAKSKKIYPKMSHLKIINDIAIKYNLEANDLLKIAYVESKFKQDAVRVNTNGTTDIGMFQINSIHWTGKCKDLDVFKLKGNAECAARLLKKHSKKKNQDAEWIGRYHSKTPSLKKKYVKLLNDAPLFSPLASN